MPLDVERVELVEPFAVEVADAQEPPHSLDAVLKSVDRRGVFDVGLRLEDVRLLLVDVGSERPDSVVIGAEDTVLNCSLGFFIESNSETGLGSMGWALSVESTRGKG